MKYEVTKHFTKGILKDITITELTNVNFTLNKQYEDYKIINIREI